ncbi:MAG: hypothetical protein R6V10_03740 [bacterium]
MAGNKEPFLKRQNWFLSAGLTFFIYILLIVITRYAPAEAREGILKLIHVIPLLAVFMIVIGFAEKKRKEDWDRERKRKRYETTMRLSKMKKRKSSGSASPPGGGQEKKPSDK